jgi:hypothetical protein
MLLQALEVTLDCLTDVFGRFHARPALGNTPGQSRARGHKHTVFIWFQVNAIPHYPAFYQSGGTSAERGPGPDRGSGHADLAFRGRTHRRLQGPVRGVRSLCSGESVLSEFARPAGDTAPGMYRQFLARHAAIRVRIVFPIDKSDAIF